jgi:hypothetical protein
MYVKQYDTQYTIHNTRCDIKYYDIRCVVRFEIIDCIVLDNDFASVPVVKVII